jgi:hypothetical protein
MHQLHYTPIVEAAPDPPPPPAQRSRGPSTDATILADLSRMMSPAVSTVSNVGGPALTVDSTSYKEQAALEPLPVLADAAYVSRNSACLSL